MNCKLRQKTETAESGMSVQTTTRWSDAVGNTNCEVGYTSSRTVSSGLVSNQGQNTVLTGSLKVDLSHTKLNYGPKDLSGIALETTAQSFRRSLSSNDKHRPSVEESRTKVTGALTLVDGTPVNLTFGGSRSFQGSYVDDSETRNVGTESSIFVVEMPFGAVTYESVTRVDEKGESKTRISLNGAVIYETPNKN
jgi:hypothetical protein